MAAKLIILTGLIALLWPASRIIARAACPEDVRLNGEYLDLTRGGQHVYLGQLELKSMQVALRPLELSDLKAGPEAIKARLARLNGRNPNGLDAKLLAALVDLAQPKAECSQELTRKWFKLKAFAKLSGNDNERNRELVCYLLHFGAQKFAKCAGKLDAGLKANFRADSPISLLLDQYFGQALRSSGFDIRSEADLREQIHKLRVDDSNASTLVQLAARWVEGVSRDRLLQDFLRYQSKAAKFMPSGRHLFTVVNLARDLGQYSPRDANLIKLNEFHRLVCASQRLKSRDENLRGLCQFVQLQGQLLMLD